MMIVQNLKGAYGHFFKEASTVWSNRHNSEDSIKVGERIAALVAKILGAVCFLIALPVFFFSASHIATITGFLGVITSLFFFVLGHDFAAIGKNNYELYVNERKDLLSSKISEIFENWERIEDESSRKDLKDLAVICQNTFLLGPLWLYVVKRNYTS